MEGDGEMAGIAHRMWLVEGCGGMWLKKLGEKWEKNGSKMGRDTPFLTVPFCPFFRRSKIFPTVPFTKISSPHSPTEK